MKHFFVPFLISILLIFSGCSEENFEAQPQVPNQKPDTSSGLFEGEPVKTDMAGVNWADPRDNFVDGWIIPSGLKASDNYGLVRQKTSQIIAGFQKNMGANTVRLPINPSTVLEWWWQSYSGAIDMSLSRGMKVVLACWEANSSRDGKVDDPDQFWRMWDVVVSKYENTPNVYFEVFNEPHGYSVEELKSLYAAWLDRYPQLPRGRILLGGRGYSEDVKPIGDDSRFSECLLSLHIYAWWGHHTSPTPWETQLRNSFGRYGSRTVLTEFGVPMTTGMNYKGDANGNYEIAFLQGITNELRRNGISSIYWPGLRNSDSYSIQQLGGGDHNLSLTTTNHSGLDRIRWGWGVGARDETFKATAYYRLINRKSGHALDINGASKDWGAPAIQWEWNGGDNQQWQIQPASEGYYRLVNKNSSLIMDINGASKDWGAPAIQWDWNGGDNQQWQVQPTSDGYYRLVNKNSGLILDVNSASTDLGVTIIQWPWNGGNNQQWQIIEVQ